MAISVSAAIALVALTAFALLQTQRARVDAERARLSAEFMESVLKAADPLTSKKAIQTALDLMDAANENMQSKFGARPDLSAPTTILIANAYANLGAISRAYPMYEQAIRDLRANQTPWLELAKALERAASAAERNGELAQSKAWLDELKVMLQHQDTIETRRLREGALATRWQMARDSGDLLPQALVLAEQGLANLVGFEAQMQAERQTALRRRGVLYTDMGKFSEAEADLLASRDLALKLFGPKHGRTAIIRQSLGWHYVSAGDPKRGLQELIEVAEIVREVFGEVSQVYGASLHNRGNAYLALKQVDLALDSYQKSAQAYRGSTSNSSIQVGSALMNVAEILRQKGDLAGAAAVFAEVEEAWSTSMPPDAPARASLYCGQARLADAQTKAKRAAHAIEQCLTIYRETGANAMGLAEALALQGHILAPTAELRAISAFDEAISLRQTLQPPDPQAIQGWQRERGIVQKRLAAPRLHGGTARD